MRGHKLDHLAINSTTAVAGKAGFTLASAATAVVEFMAKWLTLYLRTVVLEMYRILQNTKMLNELYRPHARA